MLLVDAPASPFDFASPLPPVHSAQAAQLQPADSGHAAHEYASPLFDSSVLEQQQAPMPSQQASGFLLLSPQLQPQSANAAPLLHSPLAPAPLSLPIWGASSTDSMSLAFQQQQQPTQPAQRPPSSTPLVAPASLFPPSFPQQPTWGTTSTDSLGSLHRSFGAYRGAEAPSSSHHNHALTSAFTTATTDSGPDSDEELAHSQQYHPAQDVDEDDGGAWQPAPSATTLTHAMSYEDSSSTHASPAGAWSEAPVHTHTHTSEFVVAPYTPVDGLAYSTNSSTAAQINQRNHEVFAAAAAFSVGPATLAYQDFNAAYKSIHSAAQLPMQQQAEFNQHLQLQQLQQQKQEQSKKPSAAKKPSSSKKKATTASGASDGAAPPSVAKRSCIPCRKLKASCDDGRPCGRCVKFGRECVDRPEEEVEAARERRKRTRAPMGPDGNPLPRPNSRKKKAERAAAAAAAAANAAATHSTSSNGSQHSSHSHPSSPSVHSPVLHAPSPSPSTNPRLRATMGSGRELYSRLTLNAAIRQGHRDAILNLHTLLQAAPTHLAPLLQWHTQVQLSLVHFADFLTEGDLITFLTHGLTEEQMQSPAWLSSPLAPWTKPSTRSMHFAWQNDSDSAGGGGLAEPGSLMGSNNSSRDGTSQLAQFKFDFLPESNAAFQNWERMCTARAAYERRVREATTGVKAPPVPNPISALGDLSLLSSRQKRQVLASLASTTIVQEGAPGSSLEELSALVDLLSCLNVGRALPPTEWHPDMLTQRSTPKAHHAHAGWCPLSSLPERGRGVRAVDNDELNHARKKQDVHGSGGSGSAAAAGVSSSDGAVGRGESGSGSSFATSVSSSPPLHCLCELSTALPVRVRVNSAFERLFGWSQAEVLGGLEREGMAWVRNLYPPSIWPSLIEAQLAQRKAFFEFTTAMAQASLGSHSAAAAAAAAAGVGGGGGSGSSSTENPSAAPSLPAQGAVKSESSKPDLGPYPHLSHTLPTEVANKWGAVLPALLVKHTSLGEEGGEQQGNVTGFVYSWEVVPPTQQL